MQPNCTSGRPDDDECFKGSPGLGWGTKKSLMSETSRKTLKQDNVANSLVTDNRKGTYLPHCVGFKSFVI